MNGRQFRAQQLPDCCRLLAPAGGKDSLIAAANAGADGVYFGARTLNARQKADNFDDDDLLWAAAFCRERGMESFLTLNTLLRADEQEQAFFLLEQATNAGITGVIVQDLSLPRRIRKAFPSLALHASTQMAVTSAAGARMLEALHYDQVVLARELSGKEIANITKSTALHTEVFVHGALCMSVSGQCYLSSVIGGRSGNRGLCAQPCRLDFSMPGFEKCLSLKDLCLLRKLEQLKAAGVRTLKIEGRLKRPEYVTAAVSAYRAALDGQPPDTDALASVFSRSGFTDGYFTGEITRKMFGFRRKEDVASASAAAYAQLRRKAEKEILRVPVTGSFLSAEGAPCTLTVSDGTHTCTVSGLAAQKAATAPTTRKNVAALLEKTGATCYGFTELKINMADGLFLPDSALRSLRRAAFSALSEKRTALPPQSKADKALFCTPPAGQKRSAAQRLFALCKTVAQAKALLAQSKLSFDRIFLPFAEAKKADEAAKPFLSILLPAVFFDRSETALLAELRAAGFQRVFAQTPGGFYAAAQDGFETTCGPTMNVRSAAAEETLFSLGADAVVRSFESGLHELSDCGDKSGAVVYGRLPLMLLRACPRKADQGCAGCPRQYEITDRTRRTFPVLCDGEAAVLYNAEPLVLSDRLARFSAAGILVFCFTDESPAQIASVCTAYAAAAPPKESFTRGLYERKLSAVQPDSLRKKRLNNR